MAKNVNVQFNGPVGQTVVGGKFGRVDTKITMGEDGEMIVDSVITGMDDEDDEGATK